MQRVATDLHDALAAHPKIQWQAEVLRTTWKMTHVRFVPFAVRLMRQVPLLVSAAGYRCCSFLLDGHGQFSRTLALKVARSCETGNHSAWARCNPAIGHLSAVCAAGV